MDEPSVLSSVLEGSITRLVNQHQDLLYRCSSTVQAPFPLSAADVGGKGRGGGAGSLHAAGTKGGHSGAGHELGGRGTGGASDCLGVCCMYMYTQGGLSKLGAATIRGPSNGEVGGPQGTHDLRRGAPGICVSDGAQIEALTGAVYGSEWTVCWRRWPVKGRNACRGRGGHLGILRPVWLTSSPRVHWPKALGSCISHLRPDSRGTLSRPWEQQHRAHAGAGTRGVPFYTHRKPPNCNPPPSVQRHVVRVANPAAPDDLR